MNADRLIRFSARYKEGRHRHSAFATSYDGMGKALRVSA
jgi:hypothetical protein